MDVGDGIRELRENAGMTQVELGKVAGVSSNAVSQWYNKRAVPRMGAIQRIADYFGIPKSIIMGDSMASSTSTRMQLKWTPPRPRKRGRCAR